MEDLREPLADGPATRARRYNVARSCLRCHAHKIRCDKSVPCSRCVAAKATCQYPGPERVKRRSARLPLAKVVPRLEALEQAVVSITGRSAPSAPSAASTPSQPRESDISLRTIEVATDQRSPSERAEGILVKDGTSTLYINETLFTRVLDEETELQSAIDSPASAESAALASSTPGFDGLLSYPQLSPDISHLYPTRRQAAQLWQVYLNNVDPILRILHVPTTQPAVFAAINNPAEAPADLHALLLAIYLAAVTSLPPAETQLLLGQDKKAALSRFQRAVEIQLHKASFLDAPTILSLQAMSISLFCRRAQSGDRSGWTLNGLLIRAAQLVGLHRDGEHFRLAPIECEVRRRLWWHILGYDARIAEDHGLSTGGFDGSSDTKLPLNIDDRDLTPSMQTLPTPEPKWTEMTLSLVIAEMNQAIRRISQLSVSPSPSQTSTNNNTNPPIPNLDTLATQTTTRLEHLYLRHCDPNIPIQKAALHLGRALAGKLAVLVRQQALRGLSAADAAARAGSQEMTDTLARACDAIALRLELETDEMLAGFQWVFRTYLQYHLLTYVLWHLRVQPDVEGKERAWQVVGEVFAMVEGEWKEGDGDGRRARVGLGGKWNVLRRLREMAVEARVRAEEGGRGSSLVGEASVGANQDEFALDMGAFGDGMAWDFDSVCFPDWAGFLPVLQGFDMPGP